jgi:hypothetical protein
MGTRGRGDFLHTSRVMSTAYGPAKGLTAPRAGNSAGFRFKTPEDRQREVPAL